MWASCGFKTHSPNPGPKQLAKTSNSWMFDATRRTPMVFRSGSSRQSVLGPGIVVFFVVSSFGIKRLVDSERFCNNYPHCHSWNAKLQCLMVDLEASTALIFDNAISPIENPWTDDFPIKKWKFWLPGWSHINREPPVTFRIHKYSFLVVKTPLIVVNPMRHFENLWNMAIKCHFSWVYYVILCDIMCIGYAAISCYFIISMCCHAM